MFGMRFGTRKRHTIDMKHFLKNTRHQFSITKINNHEDYFLKLGFDHELYILDSKSIQNTLSIIIND